MRTLINNDTLCPDLKMNWTKSFEALGVKFDDKLEDMNVNITEAIVKIKATLKSWKKYDFSINSAPARKTSLQNGFLIFAAYFETELFPEESMF